MEKNSWARNQLAPAQKPTEKVSIRDKHKINPEDMAAKLNVSLEIITSMLSGADRAEQTPEFQQALEEYYNKLNEK